VAFFQHLGFATTTSETKGIPLAKTLVKQKVSNLANKELKQELNQAARVAIKWNADLKMYAERKLQEKPYKVVLNNVKFKLILRMFALVNRGELYVDKYQKVA